MVRQAEQIWSYKEISKAFRANQSTITQIAKRVVMDGIDAALGRTEQQNRHRKVDGEVEAHIVALACSEAPGGRERWTLHLIADELVRLGVVGSISDSAVGNTLKKTSLSLCSGVLSRHCLSEKMTSIEEMRKISAWPCRRNAASATVNWRFTTADARMKLKKLYPVILDN